MPKTTDYDNDDRGYLTRNEDAKTERHPSHKGKITLSKETLKALTAMYQDQAEPILYISAWRAKKAGMLTLKVEAPQAYRGGADGKRQQREEPRRAAPPRQTRGSFTDHVDDDDSDFDERIPF